MNKDVQVIARDGEPEYAVIPYAEYLRLRDTAEMADDIAAYDRAKSAALGEERVPGEVVARLVAGDHPVRVWREYRKMTQSEIARATGVSGAYLSQIELGKREGTIKLYGRLARALAVDVDHLVLWDQADD